MSEVKRAVGWGGWVATNVIVLIAMEPGGQSRRRRSASPARFLASYWEQSCQRSPRRIQSLHISPPPAVAAAGTSDWKRWIARHPRQRFAWTRTEACPCVSRLPLRVRRVGESEEGQPLPSSSGAIGAL